MNALERLKRAEVVEIPDEDKEGDWCPAPGCIGKLTLVHGDSGIVFLECSLCPDNHWRVATDEEEEKLEKQ